MAGCTLGRLEAGVFLFIFMFYSKNIVYKNGADIRSEEQWRDETRRFRFRFHGNEAAAPQMYKKQTQTWSSR